MKIVQSNFLVFIVYLRLGESKSVKMNCDKHPALTVEIENKSNSAVIYSHINSKSDETEILVDYPANVKIVCQSSEPIEMNFKGEMIKIFTNVKNRRYASDYDNASTYCFTSQLSFDADESATGLYSCKQIETRYNQHNQLTVSTYIFANNGRGKEGHLLNSGKCISNEGQIPENSELIIPCVVSNNVSRPELYKLYEKCSNQRYTPEVTEFAYDNKKGFLINVSNTDEGDCWADFACVLGNETLFVSNMKPKEFRVTPPISTIVFKQKSIVLYAQHSYSKFNLICESKDTKTIFRHTLPDNNNVHESIKFDPTTFYKYKSTLNYEGEFATGSMEAPTGSTFNVSCYKADHSEIPLHTWVILYKAFNDETGLKFSEKLQSFSCYSVTLRPTLPILSLIDCNNPLNCRNAELNFHYKLNGRSFPFNVSDNGYQCRNQSKSQIYTGCSEYPIEKGKPFGMAHCRTGEHNYFLTYYTTTEKNIVTTLERQPVKTAIKLTIAGNNMHNSTFYVNETIKFECLAIPILFSMGLHLEVKIENNGKIERTKQNNFPPEAYFKPDGHNETMNDVEISYFGQLTIWSEQIREIRCYAPIMTSKQWLYSSQNLTVEEGEYPRVLENEPVNITFFEKENNQSLECKATGYPVPNITWGKSINDGVKEDYKQIITADSETVIISTLYFPTLSTLFDGTYMCVATNAKGSSWKIFYVQVKDNTPSLTLYLIITGCVSALFLLLLLILIRALRKQKKEIEKLSEAEILEFEHGNETMAKHAGELNEIAQYLPYNQEYEIPDKELELIDEDMLGSGAFGVVLKGFLEKDGEKYPVAIKTLKLANNVSQLKKLLAEIKIMMYIGRHVNIIDLIGAQTRKLRDGKVFVIVEYCAFGNLQSFLRERRNEFIDQVFNDRIDPWITRSRVRSIKQNRNPLTRLQDSSSSLLLTRRISQQEPAINTLNLISWCHQLANGMEYLEMKKVIHGDLATRNLLLTDDWTLKITDFGLSTHMYEYAEYIQKQKVEPLPWRWLSVEAIRDSKFSIWSDVWAFGVTVWEIFTLGEMPYPDCFWGEEFVKALYKGYRMSKPQYSTTELYNIIQQCWSPEMLSRPTFKDLKEYFHKTFEACSNSNEKILEDFLGPDGFNFQCKSVQTTTDIESTI